MRALRVTVALGVRDDHLLISIGTDTAHLEKLGTGASLAKSPALARIASHAKGPVFHVAYFHEDLASHRLEPAELSGVINGLAGLLDEDQREDFREDAGRILPRLNAGLLPTRSPLLSFSFIDRGIRSYVFAGEHSERIDTSKALTGILRSVGPEPLAFLATRGPRLADVWPQFTDIIATGWGWFERIARSEMSPMERESFDAFRDIARPLARSIDRIVRERMTRAFATGESLLTVDAGGHIPVVPGTTIGPIHYPRPSFVLPLADAEALVTGSREVRAELIRAIERLPRSDLDDPARALPLPDARPHAGGTLYTWPLPPFLPNFEPHALVTEDRLVLALAPEISKAIVESKEAPKSSVVDFGAPAGAVYYADLVALAELLLRNANTAVDALAAEGELPAPIAGMVRLHIPELRAVAKSLVALRGRVYTDGGDLVHHAWFEMRDLPEE